MRPISLLHRIVTHIPPHPNSHQTTTGTFHANTAYPTHTRRVNYSASAKQINNSELAVWQSKLLMMLLQQLVLDHTNTCAHHLNNTFSGHQLHLPKTGGTDTHHRPFTASTPRHHLTMGYCSTTFCSHPLFSKVSSPVELDY